jgi:hypothetical protein
VGIIPINKDQIRIRVNINTWCSEIKCPPDELADVFMYNHENQ